MPQDICLNQRASERASGVPTGFIITVVVLAMAALIMKGPSLGGAVLPDDATGVVLEDWHGNVMRSQ